MKINNFNATNLIQVYSSQNKKAKSDSSKPLSNGGADRVEISPEAKELLELKQKMLEIPEGNEKRIATLKEKITKGEYQVDAREVAKKMLDIIVE